MYLTDELFPEGLRESVEPLDEGGDHGRRRETDHGVQVGRGLRLAELRSQSSPHRVHLMMSRRRRKRRRRRQDSIDLLISLRSGSRKKSFDPRGIAITSFRMVLSLATRCTIWGVRSLAMFCFVFFRKFRLPISCTIAAVSAQQSVEHVKNTSRMRGRPRV